jgi:hypothetical protein
MRAAFMSASKETAYQMDMKHRANRELGNLGACRRR